MSLTNSVSSLTNIIRGLVNDRVQADGNNVYEYDTDNTFRLSEPFVDSSSINVYQNETLIDPSDWTYNADTNQFTIVFVTSGGALVQNDIIRSTYNYYKKYSDTEIQGFLESSLSYFVQHRYKKVFEVNSSNEIVTVNGINPTTDELYFICVIASILIDPQNIEINTPEFKLSAKRSQSDQEQISKSFAQFKKFVGKVDFYSSYKDDTKWHY